MSHDDMAGDSLASVSPIRREIDESFDGPNPSGFCKCGCGRPTPIAKRSDGQTGAVQGLPVRFLVGHSTKGKPGPHRGRAWPWVFNSKKGRWYVWGRNSRNYNWARVLMEGSLGRELSRGEIVHHINGDRTDDRLENLQVLTRAEHNALHVKQGDSGWERMWLKKTGRFNEINGIPFDEIVWHQDPVRIARLWRFLDLTDRTPIDTALFIEAAASYQQEYEELAMWSGQE